MENTGDSVPGVKQWQWTWRTVARFRKHLLHKIRTNNVIRPTACCVCLIKDYYLGRTKVETSFCPSCFLARHFHPKMESSLNGMASHSGSCLYSEVVVAQLCPTLCSPMDCITPGFPVLYCLPEFTQTHVHWFDDAIQPSHSLSPPSAALNLSQHQGLFQWVSSSHQVAKVLELQLQHQSFQWIFRVVFL